jgi:hypothetical protein
MDALPLRSAQSRGFASFVRTWQLPMIAAFHNVAVAPLPVRGQLYGRKSRDTALERFRTRKLPSVFHLEQKEPLTSAAHAALRRTALMHCRNNNYRSPRNVFSSASRSYGLRTAEQIGS